MKEEITSKIILENIEKWMKTKTQHPQIYGLSTSTLQREIIALNMPEKEKISIHNIILQLQELEKEKN